MVRYLCFFVLWVTISSSFAFGLAPSFPSVAQLLKGWNYQTTLSHLNQFFETPPRFDPGTWKTVQTELELSAGCLPIDLQHKIIGYMFGQREEVQVANRYYNKIYPCLWSEVDEDTYKSILDWFLNYLKKYPPQGTYLYEGHDGFVSEANRLVASISAFMFGHKGLVHVYLAHGGYSEHEGHLLRHFPVAACMNDFYGELFDFANDRQYSQAEGGSDQSFRTILDEKNIPAIVSQLKDRLTNETDGHWSDCVSLLVPEWSSFEPDQRAMVFDELLEGWGHWTKVFEPRSYRPMMLFLRDITDKHRGSLALRQEMEAYLDRVEAAIDVSGFQSELLQLKSKVFTMAKLIKAIRELPADHPVSAQRYVLTLFKSHSSQEGLQRELQLQSDDDHEYLLKHLLLSKDKDLAKYLKAWPTDLRHKHVKSLIFNEVDRRVQLRLFRGIAKSELKEDTIFVASQYQDFKASSWQTLRDLSAQTTPSADDLLWGLELVDFLKPDHSPYLPDELFGYTYTMIKRFYQSQKKLRATDPVAFLKEVVRWRKLLGPKMYLIKRTSSWQAYRLLAWVIEEPMQVRSGRNIMTYQPRLKQYLFKQRQLMKHNAKTMPWYWQQAFVELHRDGLWSQAQLDYYREWFREKSWLHSKPLTYTRSLLSDWVENKYVFLDDEVLKQELEFVVSVLESKQGKFKNEGGVLKNDQQSLKTGITFSLQMLQDNPREEVRDLLNRMSLAVNGSQLQSRAA